jgi:hypothetical protein
LDLLGLKPCPTRHHKDVAVNWAMCVCYLANLEGILTYFWRKVKRKLTIDEHGLTRFFMMVILGNRKMNLLIF